MNTVKPVVVGIADKQPSALRFAITEARSHGRPLRVVHAYGLPAQPAEFYLGGGAGAVADDLRAAGQDVLDDARHVIDGQDPSLDVEYVLSDRAPLEALEHEAVGAGVMIVGADDVPWLERLLRTRVAGHLVMHAPCPVIVVPEQELPSAGGGEVVVTLDGDTRSAGPLRLAFEEADARDCLLNVLHSTPPGTLAADVIASHARASDVLAEVRAEHPDVEVLESNPLDDIAAAATRASQVADLVVVGRPSHPHLSLLLARPVAVSVLSRARCAVAVVPAGYAGQRPETRLP